MIKDYGEFRANMKARTDRIETDTDQKTGKISLKVVQTENRQLGRYFLARKGIKAGTGVCISALPPYSLYFDILRLLSYFRVKLSLTMIRPSKWGD